MSVLTGTVKNGLIILDDPASLPEGSRVLVRPAAASGDFGMSEADWHDTPEAIADWLAWYDSLEPIEISTSEREATDAFRDRQKEHGKSAFDERCERLCEIWR